MGERGSEESRAEPDIKLRKAECNAYTDTSSNMSTRELTVNTIATPTVAVKRPRPRRPRATQRERQRMQLLNQAFENLRRVVPRTHLADYQRLSKIATLRLAIQYIRAMAQILTEDGAPGEEVCVGSNSLVFSSLIDMTEGGGGTTTQQLLVYQSGQLQSQQSLPAMIAKLDENANNTIGAGGMRGEGVAFDCGGDHHLVDYSGALDW